MPISIIFLKLIQNNFHQNLWLHFPRHNKFSFQVCLLIFKIVLCIGFSTRTVFNWQFQSIQFDLCLWYRVLATLRLHRFVTVQVSNLIIWNCQKDWWIHKFVSTLHCKHLDNNTMATKNGKPIYFEHLCEQIYFILFTIYLVICVLSFDYL